jgi:hypothetical protein
VAAITSTADRELLCDLSIPVHADRPLKIGLLKHLAKLAEISDDELE